MSIKILYKFSSVFTRIKTLFIIQFELFLFRSHKFPPLNFLEERSFPSSLQDYPSRSNLKRGKSRWSGRKKSARHDRASASVTTLVQRVNDFSPHPGERKRVRNEFEARVDRFVIAVDPLFAKRLFLLARLCLLSFCHHPPVPRCSLANSLSRVQREQPLSLSLPLSLLLLLGFE